MIHDKKIISKPQNRTLTGGRNISKPKTGDATTPVPGESLQIRGGKGDDRLMKVGMMGLGTGAAAAIVSGSLAAGLASGGMASVGVAGTLAGPLVGMALGGGAKEAFKNLYKENLAEAKNQRTRNADGRFRQKSGATHLDTLRETYGPNFAAGLPGNMPLQVLRATTGMSLTKLVQNPDKIAEKKEELSSWEPPKPAPGGRTRNADGRIRQKRGDTKIDTLRKSYGPDLMAQLPGNWPLALVREATGMSLSKLVESPDKVSEALPKIAAEAVGMDVALDPAGDREEAVAEMSRVDNTSADIDPREGKVATQQGVRKQVGDFEVGYFSSRIDSVFGERSVTHHPVENGTGKTELKNQKPFGKKPLASHITVSYDDATGKMTSIEDKSAAV